MERLTDVAGFGRLVERIAAERDPALPTIVVPAGTCGQASGSNDLIRVAKRELLQRGLVDRVGLRITGCHGLCQMEPSVLVEPARTFYPRLTMEGMERVVAAVAAGAVVEDLLWQDPSTGERIAVQEEIPFFARQRRTILARNEKVDPIRIYNYLATGGYAAFVDALGADDPAGILATVTASGLRGRGGAGFPTGRKWQMLAEQPNGRGKFLVCNADEGDPGAYMDRSVLEGNPHGVIEGMLIGALATGADHGIVYVRAEYPLAIKHLVIALRQAEGLGLLGDDILGTGRCFRLQLVRGAGAFVCGEETALIASLDGRPGLPRQRPPFPVERGVEGRPTAINNVETWANVPVILAGGADAFAAVGTPGNAGTKIFSLVGKVRNTGLVEVPMGTSIAEIVLEIGGGAPDGRPLKAVQTGGPSGGCLPAARFDLPIDYDSLKAAGSIMGSGGMIVMDQDTCVVDVAHYYMGFLASESCGTCFTCRKGIQRMRELLDDVVHGRAELDHLDLLEELATAVADTTMCGLGQSAPNPVLSTLRYFRSEYVEHVVHKRCRAGVCRDLVGPSCQGACPLGTEAWRYVAHVERGEYAEAYRVIRRTNPFPSVCARLCHHPCESACRLGASGDHPVAVRALKRFVTDTVDPRTYHAGRPPRPADDAPRVAVVGAGPAGLTAAWELVRRGYPTTVFEASDCPGGMLRAGVPAYRLPREVLDREIEALVDDGVELRCGEPLGEEMSIGQLFERGFAAVFLAIGAHRSRRLGLARESAGGVIPSMRYLKTANLAGQNRARGRVGVVGGGNSAVDAARVAMRQPGVESVTIYYRRGREEMPAFAEEIAAALEEGIRLETLASPVEILTQEGALTGVRWVRNRLGAYDASGRRRAEPLAASEWEAPLDTLIVAIGEQLQSFLISEDAAALVEGGRITADPWTMVTSHPGVFAGGDAVTGPNTVVHAIAAGRRAAVSIDRFLRGDELVQTETLHRPVVYVEPSGEVGVGAPVPLPTLDAAERVRSFAEVEGAFTPEQARAEARRCLRCDLEFTRPEEPLAGQGVHA